MFDRKSTIIRDGSVLDFSYVPRNLVSRGMQISRLETLFRPLALEGRQCSALLVGSVGTGKTVTARRFCSDMSAFMASEGRPVDTVYINCRNSSEAGTLVQLIRHYDKGFPERGFSADEMARVLAQHFATNERSLVVILDEVDVLFKKGSTDLVYQLMRSRADAKAQISLIMITQEPVDRYLDEASHSTFRRTNTVRFDKYSEEELTEIASSRAEEALYPGRYTEDSIRLIAEESAEYGDARMAIELLDRAANIAEEDDAGEMTTEHVRAAKAMIYSSISDSKLRSLDVNRMLVLLAVARAMKSKLSVPSSAVEKTYAIACEEYGVAARKHTQFWTYLQDLEKLGAVRLSIDRDQSGKVSIVSLPDIPSKILAEKMQALLEEGDEDDLLRHLRTRRCNIHTLQRHAPVRRALHELRREARQEGDTQADRRVPRGPDRRGCLRREGQHGRPEAPVFGVQRQERRRGACDHD